jgi:hypothetical protein
VAWNVVQSASATAGSVSPGGTLSAAFTSNVSSGNKLIAFVTMASSGNGNNPSITSVSDGASNQWTNIGYAEASSNSATNNQEASIWALDCPSGDAGTKPTLSATLSASAVLSASVSMVIAEVSGLLAGNTTAMCDGSPATKTGSTTNTGSPTYSTGASNEFLVSLYGDFGDGNTVTTAGGWTADSSNVNTSGNTNCVVQYKNSTGGSETDGFGSADTTSAWEIIEVAFKVPAGAAAVPFQPPHTLLRGARAVKGVLSGKIAPPPVAQPSVPAKFYPPHTLLRGAKAVKGRLFGAAAPAPVIHAAVPSKFYPPHTLLRGAKGVKGRTFGTIAPPPVIHPSVPSKFYPPHAPLRGARKAGRGQLAGARAPAAPVIAGAQLYFDWPRVSPTGFQVPYLGENEGDLQVADDIQYLFNDIAITRNIDGATYRTINTASRSKYYPRIFTRTIYSSADDANAVVNCGTTLLNAFGTPQLRVQQVIVDAASNPDAWQFVLSADIGDLVSFTRTPVGGAAVTGSFLVLSISVNFAPDKAEYTYVLCPVGVF